MYGSRSDALNVGLATDRLIAEWETSGEPGGRTVPWPDTVDLLETDAGRVLGVRQIPDGTDHVSIEVPSRISDLKALGTSAAAEWQHALRAAFQTAFASGYIVSGFSRADAARPRYLLERSQ